MKIIAKDNFDTGGVPDIVIAENLDAATAKARCEELNASCGPGSPRWHVVRSDDYKPLTNEDIYS